MRIVHSIAVLGALACVTTFAFGQTLFTGTLSGDQLSPAIPSNGRGTAWAVLGADMRSLTYRVTFANLSSAVVGGHIHIDSPAGEIEVLPLTFINNTAAGTYSDIPDSVVRYLVRGKASINVHSSNFPGGEIGGALRAAQGTGFVVAMNGSQEVPANASSGQGTGYAVLDSLGQRISFDLTVEGLSDTLRSGHFHAASSGAIVKSLPFADSSAHGAWTGFADSILTALLRGGLYLNVHTKKYPGGELRGTVTPVGPVMFTATMTGDQEAPAVVTNARGTFWGLLSADMTSLTYRFTYARLNSSRTGAHFHAGGTGNGAVVHPISFSGNTSQGTWTNLADSVVRHAFRGELYVNIHSSTSPGGEIRGILHPAAGIALATGLSGAAEVPANPSTALGTAFALLDSTGTQIAYDATIAGLSDTLRSAHFHALSSGGVVKPITFLDSTSSGAWSGFADSILTAYLRGGLYMNVHSKAYPGGEIRGILGSLTGQATAVREILPAIPDRMTLEQNFPNPFNPATTIAFQLHDAGRVRLVVYDLLGRQVAILVDGVLGAGTHTATWNAAGFASGVYFYRMTTDREGSALRKMMLVK
jgi:hypothetical protein